MEGVIPSIYDALFVTVLYSKIKREDDLSFYVVLFNGRWTQRAYSSPCGTH